jgi:4-amino-4-deoxy-L-arabinose transferase-like glycosyltransferase
LYPLLALHLLTLRRGFDEGSSTWALAAGATIGLSVYAYTGFRLLAPLYVMATLGCYSASTFRKSHIYFVTGAAICAIPFAIYALSHFDNLTERFRTVTYLNGASLTLPDKVGVFLQHYFGYFDVSFLAISGDDNRRHHTGFGGELFATTVVLLIISVVQFYREGKDRFRSYVLVGLLLSVLAAGLTDDTHNSIRGFAFATFAVLLSAYGLRTLTPVISRVTVAITGLLACLYLVNYFVVYPSVSAVAFENYNFKKALSDALEGTPARVVLSSEGNVPYINLRFFGSLIGTKTPLVIGTRQDARAGDAYISYDPKRAMSGMYQVECVH